MPKEDSGSKFDSLTAIQRDALSAVADGYTSKEIALREGIHFRTVDARIERAVAALGARNRAEAARLYRDHITAPRPYGQTTYDPAHLGQPPDPEPSRPYADRLNDVGAAPFTWAPPPPAQQPERVGIWINLGNGLGGKLGAVILGTLAIIMATLFVALLYDTVQTRIHEANRPSRNLQR